VGVVLRLPSVLVARSSGRLLLQPDCEPAHQTQTRQVFRAPVNPPPVEPLTPDERLRPVHPAREAYGWEVLVGGAAIFGLSAAAAGLDLVRSARRRGELGAQARAVLQAALSAGGAWAALLAGGCLAAGPLEERPALRLAASLVAGALVHLACRAETRRARAPGGEPPRLAERFGLVLSAVLVSVLAVATAGDLGREAFGRLRLP